MPQVPECQAPRCPSTAMGRVAESRWRHALLGPTGLTWDVLGPANDDHELPVCEVTESGQGLDVTLRHARGRHGVQLVRLRHQQVRDNLGHCNDQRGKISAWERQKGRGAWDGSGRRVSSEERRKV